MLQLVTSTIFAVVAAAGLAVAVYFLYDRFWGALIRGETVDGDPMPTSDDPSSARLRFLERLRHIQLRVGLVVVPIVVVAVLLGVPTELEYRLWVGVLTIAALYFITSALVGWFEVRR